ncbi:MAG: DDE transposase, partial [Clostridia bacterium]|nr:DDE transposase [Clostridia bacterium]
RFRNGVETLPSILKNVYNVNKMPVRGKIHCKFFFGSKVAALNFKKLLGFRRGTGKYAQNALLTAGC